MPEIWWLLQMRIEAHPTLSCLVQHWLPTKTQELSICVWLLAKWGGWTSTRNLRRSRQHSNVPTWSDYIPQLQTIALRAPVSLALSCVGKGGTAWLMNVLSKEARLTKAYFIAIQFWMLWTDTQTQTQRQGQKTSSPQLWQQLYRMAVKEGSVLTMASVAMPPDKGNPTTMKLKLPQLTSYMAK